MINQLSNSLNRQLWLAYFNQVLFQQGIISHAAYQHMLLRIHNDKAGVFTS